MPWITCPAAFDFFISRWLIASLISSKLSLNKFILCCAGGNLYSSPGNISRTDDLSASIRLTHSIILFDPSTRTILLYLPIISIITLNETGSPRSFFASKTRVNILSNPSCLISTSFAPQRCLRRSIVSMGGFAGFSICCCVSWITGQSAFADKSSFWTPSNVLNVKSISSREGWYILSTLKPRSFCVISFFNKCKYIPSSAIVHLNWFYGIFLRCDNKFNIGKNPA